jgi:hypothetical protein
MLSIFNSGGGCGSLSLDETELSNLHPCCQYQDLAMDLTSQHIITRMVGTEGCAQRTGWSWLVVSSDPLYH